MKSPGDRRTESGALIAYYITILITLNYRSHNDATLSTISIQRYLYSGGNRSRFSLCHPWRKRLTARDMYFSNRAKELINRDFSRTHFTWSLTMRFQSRTDAVVDARWCTTLSSGVSFIPWQVLIVEIMVSSQEFNIACCLLNVCIVTGFKVYSSMF